MEEQIILSTEDDQPKNLGELLDELSKYRRDSDVFLEGNYDGAFLSICTKNQDKNHADASELDRLKRDLEDGARQMLEAAREEQRKKAAFLDDENEEVLLVIDSASRRNRELKKIGRIHDVLEQIMALLLDLGRKR